MKKTLSLLILFVIRLQGATLDMQSSPSQPPGTQYGINQYFEDGFTLKPLGPVDTTPPYRLTRCGGGIAGYPDNGGAFLQLLSGDSLVISSTDGAPFNVYQIDLAEYSTVFPVPKVIRWRGYFADLTFVDVSFTTDGIIDGTGSARDFQTFAFPATFRNLVRLEARDTGFSLDNVVVEKSATPIAVPDLLISTAVRLRWQSQVGVLYQVQISENLIDWQNQGEPIQGDGSLKEVFDSNDIPRKFWRVVAFR